MKTIKLLSKALSLGLFLISSTVLYGQDPVTVAPHIYKKIALDNDKARVMEVEIAVNETVPWHSHSDHIVYALTDGKIEITDKGKAPVVMDIKAGDAMFIPSVTHMAKNIGTTHLKLVVTEMKPKMIKKMKAVTATSKK